MQRETALAESDNFCGQKKALHINRGSTNRDGFLRLKKGMQQAQAVLIK